MTNQTLTPDQIVEIVTKFKALVDFRIDAYEYDALTGMHTFIEHNWLEVPGFACKRTFRLDQILDVITAFKSEAA